MSILYILLGVLLIVALALALWAALEGPMYDYDDWRYTSEAEDPVPQPMSDEELKARTAKLDADLKAAQQRLSKGQDTYSDLALTEEETP